MGMAEQTLRYSRSMNGETNLVTIYRSADADADQASKAVYGYLRSNGINAVFFNDEEQGVVQGSAEVRVPSSEVAQAEELLANFDPDNLGDVDPSSELDLEPIVSLMGATAEMEAF